MAAPSDNLVPAIPDGPQTLQTVAAAMLDDAGIAISGRAISGGVMSGVAGRMHCTKDPVICGAPQGDIVGAAADDTVDDPYYAYFESVMGWFYVIIGLVVALVIGFYFIVRSRPEIPLDPDSFRVGPVEVHPSRRNCLVNSQEVPLTARDITLLRCFVDQEGGTVAQAELFDAGWGESHRPSADVLDQHLQDLGAKLGHAGLFVQSTGQGYRIAD